MFLKDNVWTVEEDVPSVMVFVNVYKTVIRNQEVLYSKEDDHLIRTSRTQINSIEENPTFQRVLRGIIPSPALEGNYVDYVFRVEVIKEKDERIPGTVSNTFSKESIAVTAVEVLFIRIITQVIVYIIVNDVS